jgi:hypothetical protein
MAARRKTTDDPTPTPTPTVTLALAPRPSDGVRRASKEDHNPTEEHVLSTLDNGPLAYDVDTEEEVKTVQGMLRRAAQKHQIGLRQSVSARQGGGFTIDFEAKREKRSRKYTHKDIRAWAVANGWGEVTGPIPTELRTAFRVANGYAKEEN